MTGRPVGVVLAAGDGTRLRPLTELRPKALCPINNRALLDIAMDRIRPHVSRIAVNACHHAGQIVEHLRGTDVHVSLEATPLGSAGAIGRLASWIGGEDVLLHNADSWLEDDLAALLDGWSGEYPRLLVTDVGEGDGDFGPLRYVGVSLLPGRLVAGLTDRFSSLYELVWAPAFRRGELELVPVRGEVVDCGTPADYLRANLLANNGENVVGAGAVIEGTIEDCVVWDGCRVGPDEVLYRCVRAEGGLTVDAPTATA